MIGCQVRTYMWIFCCLLWIFSATSKPPILYIFSACLFQKPHQNPGALPLLALRPQAFAHYIHGCLIFYFLSTSICQLSLLLQFDHASTLWWMWVCMSNLGLMMLVLIRICLSLNWRNRKKIEFGNKLEVKHLENWKRPVWSIGKVVRCYCWWG